MRFFLAILAVLCLSIPTAHADDAADEALRQWMLDANEVLAAEGVDYMVAEVAFLTIGNGRPGIRLHQRPFRWVPNDPRRVAQGDDITYIFDQSAGDIPGGPTAAETEAAADRAMTTWDTARCMDGVNIVKRSDPGTDVTVVDALLGAGGFGDFTAADIVIAGWFPAGPPIFGPNALAFSVSFVFRDSNGQPTDIDGDNYLDTAFNEVYFSQGFDWAIDGELPLVDVESVVLHETGHSLALGHFGPPPAAVMNLGYYGLRQELMPIDRAGLCSVWSRWPQR